MANDDLSSDRAPEGNSPEEVLAQTQRNLREAQQLAHIGSWVWEIPSNLVHWSDEVFHLFGEDPKTYAPSYEGFMAHLSEADRMRNHGLVAAAFEGKGDFSVEHEIRRPDGTVRFVAEKVRVVFGTDGKPDRMFGTIQDITERRQNEAALKAKQRELEIQATFLQSIVDNIPLAVFIKDIRDDFRVTLWNKAAEEIYQVKKEEMIGKTAHDLWPKDQADLYLEADRKVAFENSRVDIREEPSQTKDRGTIFVNTMKLPLRLSESAKPEFLLAISHDITKERQVMAELKSAKEAAESANRAKSEFLATMSHEIRTPMNGVLGMTQLLLTTPLSAEQSEMVATLQYSGEILLSIIDDILDYSKIEAGRMNVEIQPFAITEAVRDVADMLRSQADQKSLGLNLSFPPGPPPLVLGDPNRIRQVLTNLIGNAVKFTKSGEISISTRLDGGSVRVEVTDTGIGISEESRPRIFRKFSQADTSTTRKFGGTGLGLAISKRLMELMGGHLDFTSAAGQGSTFYLTLPLAAKTGNETAAPANGKPHGDTTESLLTGLRILIAEDNVVNQKVEMKILGNLGCEVDLATTGLEAVQKAKVNAYDLILMDIQMPEMDGLEATREIRKWEASRPDANTRERIPIVAVSAGVLQDERDISRRSGMDGFLTKPILSQELAKLLLTFLRK